MLGKQGENHSRVFTALGLVNAYGIGMNEFIEFGEVIFYAPSVEFNPDFPIFMVNTPDAANISIEHILVIVIPDLHHFIILAKSAPAQFQRYSPGIESFLEREIKILGSDLATVHRTQHLYVLHGIEPEVAWNPLAAQMYDSVERLQRIFSTNKVEILFLAAVAAQVGKASLADEVCVCNDPASAGLAKYLCQTDYREPARFDNIGKDVSGTHGRELVGIANQDQGGVRGHSL
jgi:hypothetical protein